MQRREPRYFGGLDFSGAQGRAGERKRVVALLERTGDDRLRPVMLRGGWSLPQLVAEVWQCRGAWWGFDFPFGLPAAILREVGYPTPGLDDALDFLKRCDDPDTFRRWTSELASRVSHGRKELPRRTDRNQRTPFCVNNLRLYRQTFYGMTGLIAPLRDSPSVALLPWDRPRWDGEQIVVVGACPASFLRHRDWYPRKYKDPTEGARAREASLDRLIEVYALELSAADRRRLLDDGDGDHFDALICALTAREAARLPASTHEALRAEFGDCEGVVYVGGEDLRPV